MSSKRILIVEDSDTLREVLVTVLESEGYRVQSCETAEQAELVLDKQSFDCILSDFRLPQSSGLDLLRAARSRGITTPYVIMTAFGSIEIAVEAMKDGANDFISKPFEPAALVSLMRDMIEYRQIVNRDLSRISRRPRKLISQDPVIERLLKQARKVAAVDSSCLIVGESGTGKELLARFIHDHSPRADKPFIAVNCAAMPEQLLESEFFGHEQGSFTGATQTRIGVFELASEGTIFLDEIGEMPANLQVKLLRTLQELELKRVGSSKTLKINPRIIAATNIDIEEAIEARRLREDFYYRVAVITLEIPPLRRRKKDVEPMLDYYLDFFCTSLGKTTLELSPEARALLLDYNWPGNARELENIIERAAVLAESVIEPEHLALKLNIDFSALNQSISSLPEIAQNAARKAEIDTIRKMLDQTAGNKSKAAKMLGVSYKTLLNKIKDYHIQN